MRKQRGGFLWDLLLFLGTIYWGVEWVVGWDKLLAEDTHEVLEQIEQRITPECDEWCQQEKDT